MTTPNEFAEQAELEMSKNSVAAAGAASEWNDFVEIACARIKSADDAAADGDYMLDSSDCIKVLRGTWGGNYLNDHPVLPAAGAAPVPEDWRSAVAMAYGHLWHINNEPMAPIPLRSEESASYAARKLLRDLLTTEERGEAINSVRAMLTASPKEPT